MRLGGLAVLLTTLCVLAACQDAPPRPSGTAAAATERTDTAPAWRRLPAAPLEPRHQAAAFAVDGELLVLGGVATEPCPPNASCAIPAGPVFRDGAAFDPDTDTWRKLRPSPVDLKVTGGALVGDTLYLKVPDGFVGYQPAADTWRRVPSPPRYQGGERLLAMGERLLLLARGQEGGDYHDWVFDPSAGTWSALPSDPLVPSFDRDGVWTGERLIVTAKLLEAEPGSRGPSLARVAVFDPGTGTWRRLPDTGQIGGGTAPWVWVAGRAVALEPGGADGGQTNNYGRDYPFGGVLDGRGRWSPLPGLPSASGGVPWFHAAGEDVVAAAGIALHVPSSRAVAVPGDPRLPSEGAAAAWLGDRLYLWGGVRWGASTPLGGGSPRFDPPAVMLGDGWSWGPFPG